VKKLLVAVGGLVALLALLAFARYETIAPCGMLRSEAKRLVLVSAATDFAAKSDGASMLGYALGLSMLDTMLETYTARLGPGECLATLARLHTHGLPGALAADFAARATPPPIERPPPEWKFVSTKDPITDAIYSRAVLDTDDGAMWIYHDEYSFRAGVKGERGAAYDTNWADLRIDGSPAFTVRIYSKEDGVFVTLEDKQIGQMIAGSELLVRYNAAAGGSELLRFPLRGLGEAIAPIMPAPKAPSKPRPDFSKLPASERLTIWKRQYDPDGTSTISGYALATYKNCQSIVANPEPKDIPEQLFQCVSRGFPLK